LPNTFLGHVLDIVADADLEASAMLGVVRAHVDVHHGDTIDVEPSDRGCAQAQRGEEALEVVLLER
jgi:hypothetical protein